MKAVMKSRQVSVSADILVELRIKAAEMEGLVETLEIMADRKLMAKVRHARKDAAEGRIRKVNLAELD